MGWPAVVGAVIAAIKLGTDLYSMYTNAQAIQNEKDAAIGDAYFQAGQAEKAAKEIGVIGVKKEKSLQSEGQQFIGEQKSSASGTGVRLDTGTSADIIQDSERSVEADVNELRNIYANERNRLLREARYMRKTGRALGKQYDAKALASNIQGTGSVLNSAATLADRWDKYQNAS